MRKKYRLLKKADFKLLLNENKKIFTTYFVCYWSSKYLTNNIRIGIIIPKKKCKLASNRNYLKRIFWSINTKQELKSLPFIKCVFFYNNKFYDSFVNKNINFQTMKIEFVQIMKKIKNILSSHV